jgi:hypothetical protein
VSSIFQEPGLHTDTSNPRDPASMARRGFKWIVQQAQNGANPVKPWDLRAYRAQGFKVGVWGVNYADGRSTSIASDCRLLLSSLRDVEGKPADLLVMNVEYRMTVSQAVTFVDELASFTGPKALICLVGDLVAQKDALAVFVNAGWEIIGETYTNDLPNLTPAEAEWQAMNAGIPANKFSHALGMYYGLNGWVHGGEYGSLLKNMGDSRLPFQNAGRRFSCWMVEHGLESSYEALQYQANQSNPVVVPTPTPEPEPTPEPVFPTATEVRQETITDVELWKLGLSAPPASTTRLEVVRRICLPANTDAKWNQMKATIDSLLRAHGL